MVSLVPIAAGEEDAKRDAGDAFWKKLVRRIPFAYEIVQVAYNFVGIPMLLNKIFRGHADFIYERYSLFNFTGGLVARLYRIPLILEVNSPFALEQSRDKELRMVRFAQWSERTICNLATRVIVVSTPLARMMREYGVSPSKLEVMPNGVCLENFKSTGKSGALRRSLGVSYGQTVIGFVGWFRKWRGLALLWEAVHRSNLDGERVKVWVLCC